MILSYSIDTDVFAVNQRLSKATKRGCIRGLSQVYVDANYQWAKGLKAAGQGVPHDGYSWTRADLIKDGQVVRSHHAFDPGVLVWQVFKEGEAESVVLTWKGFKIIVQEADIIG